MDEPPRHEPEPGPEARPAPPEATGALTNDRPAPATDGPPWPPTNGPPQTGWAVPARDAPGKPHSRLTVALAWISAFLIAGFAAWLSLRGAAGSDAYRAGVAIGAFMAPFLFAAILRLIVVRIREGRFSRGALRSPWVPLGAIVLVALSALGGIRDLVPPAPVDAATAMRVSAPFTLREADDAIVEEVRTLMAEDAAIRSVAVRHVVGADGSVSLLVAADGRLADDGISEVERGMESESGLVAAIESIGGEEVAVATGPDGVIGSWIESPLLLSVYAVDLATLRTVVEAVIESR